MSRLSAAAILVWRPDGTMQIGVDEPLVIEGIGPGEAAILDALTAGGTTDALDPGACGAERLETLLTMLRDAGALVDDDSPPGPVIHGWAAALDAAPTSLNQRLGRARILLSGPARDAVEAGLRRASLHTSDLAAAADSGGFRDGDAVVVASWFLPDWIACARLAEAGVDHIPLVLGHDRVRLGPLVSPGTVPCTSCEYFHRADADAEWGAVAAELARRRRPVAHAEPALLGLALARLALELKSWLGTGLSDHRSLTLVLPHGGAEDRAWPFHADCQCRHPTDRSAPRLPATTATMSSP